ncbi:MAG TPA: glycosyltransferase [Thermoanaerobaculia bacterium]
MRSISRLAATLMLALLFVPTITYAHSGTALHDGMRTLWQDHVSWTRLFIVSAVAGVPDQDATTQRLLQNQTDIGNAVAEFYGKEAGDTLTALLEEHIVIAADIVTAAKAGDKAKVARSNELWKKNADAIAAFLNAANPKQWPLETLQSAMRMHLEQTLAEATHQLEGDYAASIEDYDVALHHMLMIADILSDGIMKQFPAKFTEK